MARKRIALGKLGPDGDSVSVTGTLQDEAIVAGDRTDFSVTLKRIEGPAISPLTLWVILLGTSALDLYPPFSTIGNGRIEELEPGESKRVHFLIDNGPEGATPAVYTLLCVIQWNEHPPFVLPEFSVP